MKQRNLLLTSLMCALTGGIYAVCWVYICGADYYGKNACKHKRFIPTIMVLSVLILMTLVLFVLVVGVEGLTNAFVWIFLAGLVCALVSYASAFIIVIDVARGVCRVSGRKVVCSQITAGLLTFLGFASVIYLQSGINKRLSADES